MLLPLSDAPNPRGTPVVTWALIAVNVAVYLLVTLPLGSQPPDPADPALRAYVEMVRETLPPNVPLQAALRNLSAYDLFVFEHGFRPAAPQAGDLVSSIFLHGGFMHLFGNMLFLWIYGDNVEYRLGRLRFLLYYLLTGVAATLFFTMFALDSNVPLVGASGAISGVLGFYFRWFPRNTVRMFVFLFPFFMNTVEIPARIVLGIYLFVDNVLPWIFSIGGGGGVAHGAHIGGFVAGLLIAWAMDAREVTGAPAEYRARGAGPAAPSTAGGVAQAIAEAVTDEEMEAAARAYFALPPTETARLLLPAASLALADWLAIHRHAQAALTVYRRQLRDHPSGPEAAAAHLGAGLVQLEQLGQVAPAYQHFLEALELGPSPEVAARARTGLAAIAAHQKLVMRRSVP